MPRIPLCNGVVSHGAQIGGLQAFADHTQKLMQNKCVLSTRALRLFTHIYLHAQTAVYTHLTNHGYFDCGNIPKTPNLSPMLG